MPLIVGIVAIYNPKIEDIRNIEKYIDELDYCILADDTGIDNSQVFTDFIKRHNNKILYTANKTNLGLCASVNCAVKKAKEIGADWVLIMNPDGTFSNNAVSIYRNYIKRNNCDDIAIIAPVFNIDRRPRTAGKGVKEIRYADMTGCVYNMKIFEKLGYYDKNTYFYGLDTEYCMRVKKNGYRIIECSEAVLNHCPARTAELKLFGKRIFAYGIDPPERFYYQFRSSFYINKKYGVNWNDLFMIYKLMKVLLLFDNKQKYFSAIKKGVRDARRGYYGK